MELDGLSISVLQGLRGRIDMELSRRVLGDPRIGSCFGPDGFYQTLNGVRLCSDCPPENYSTDKTRCDPCPSRK